MTQADEHRAFVERRWPELGVRTFEPVGDGWDCFTYVVNGEWVFQFPRSPGATGSLATQIAVLPELAREVSSAIPSPEYTSTDPVCMGYARIAGRSRKHHMGRRVIKSWQEIRARNQGKKSWQESRRSEVAG